ncbi:MAG: InlB B-repeat-containing protein [Clostridia bacterium]|nr:InlB B-repeat-containing protein [Clostridia bacterium]
MKKFSCFLVAIFALLSLSLFSFKFINSPKTAHAAVTYTVYFDSAGGSFVSDGQFAEGANILYPENPTRAGFNFVGWFYGDPEVLCTLTKMPAHDLYLTAHWETRQYSITKHIDTTTQSVQFDFNQEINLGNDPVKTGFKFQGWFNDSTFSSPFTLTTMPAYDIDIYASFTEKQTIKIDTSIQTYTYGSSSKAFNNFSSLTGFLVQYKVNNNWTPMIPNDAGTYDVKISRNEDENYKFFETIVSGGLVINPGDANLVFVVAVIFIFAIAEFVAAAFLMRLRRIKKQSIFSLAPISLILANQIIPKNQLILLIVASALAVAGLILLIVEFILLFKTVPDHSTTPSTYDNRRNLKPIPEDDDLPIRRYVDDPDNKFKFSKEDVQKMLNDKNYFDKHDSEKVKQAAQNSSQFEDTIVRTGTIGEELNIEDPDKFESVKIDETETSTNGEYVEDQHVEQKDLDDSSSEE